MRKRTVLVGTEQQTDEFGRTIKVQTHFNRGKYYPYRSAKRGGSADESLRLRNTEKELQQSQAIDE